MVNFAKNLFAFMGVASKIFMRVSVTLLFAMSLVAMSFFFLAVPVIWLLCGVGYKDYASFVYYVIRVHELRLERFKIK